MILIALALATLPAMPGPPANREPISAACMLEIANSPAEKEKLKQEAFRDGMKQKVRIISSFAAKQLEIAEESRLLWPEVEAQKRDLFDHGLITKEEWAGIQARSPQKTNELIADNIRRWPNCFLLDQAPDSPSKRAVLSAAAVE